MHEPLLYGFNPASAGAGIAVPSIKTFTCFTLQEMQVALQVAYPSYVTNV
jgi:hypothetical protein